MTDSPADGAAARKSGMFNVLHLEKLVKLDLIVRKDEPFRRHEFERRVRVRLAGFDTWIATREDLILSKLAWARPSGSELQLRDVRALLAGGADLGYLRRWPAASESPDCWRNASMNDTTPEFRKMPEERFLALAPAERVSMCADMFETARAGRGIAAA
jgi:hypothetical protein